MQIKSPLDVAMTRWCWGWVPTSGPLTQTFRDGQIEIIRLLLLKTERHFHSRKRLVAEEVENKEWIALSCSNNSQYCIAPPHEPLIDMRIPDGSSRELKLTPLICISPARCIKDFKMIIVFLLEIKEKIKYLKHFEERGRLELLMSIYIHQEGSWSQHHHLFE